MHAIVIIACYLFSSNVVFKEVPMERKSYVLDVPFLWNESLIYMLNFRGFFGTLEK